MDKGATDSIRKILSLMSSMMKRMGDGKSMGQAWKMGRGKYA